MTQSPHRPSSQRVYSLPRPVPPSIASLLIQALLLASCIALPLHAASLNDLTCPSPANYQPLDLMTWPPAWGTAWGTPLLKHTLDAPDAVCNDGSPAVMYIRPAQALQSGENDGPHPPSNRWLIHLSGGGECSDVQSCYQRWCGISANPPAMPPPFSRAGKMSSLGTPEAVIDFGIFDRRVSGNAFADWNHVIVYYCSSDMWSGSADLRDVSNNEGQPYDIAFRGEAIVQAVFDTLIAPASPVGPDAGLSPGLWGTYLPDLAEAETVLISGDSAGAGGVRFHIDSLHSLLAATSSSDVQVAALLDAGMPPTLEQSTWVWGPDSPGSYVGVVDAVINPGRRWFHGQDDSATDADCLAAPTVPGTAVGECFDPGILLKHHIETPYFQRMDLSDPVPSERYLAWDLTPTMEDYVTANALQLQNLPVVSPADGYGIGVGIMGSHCANHVALRTNSGFYSMGTQDTLGAKGPSFHDLVVSWLAGARPVDIQQPINGTWAASPSLDCP